eukprot:s430_g10.t1
MRVADLSLGSAGMHLPCDVWERVCTFLPPAGVANVANVASSREGTLRLAAVKAQLCWAVAAKDAFQNKWLLRRDDAKTETAGHRRPAQAGDCGKLGWSCCWAESCCSLWMHNLQDGLASEHEGHYFIECSNGLFLTPVAQPSRLSCPHWARGRWLDVQVLALLPIWQPSGSHTIRKEPLGQLVGLVFVDLLCNWSYLVPVYPRRPSATSYGKLGQFQSWFHGLQSRQLWIRQAAASDKPTESGDYRQSKNVRHGQNMLEKDAEL